MPSFGDLEKEIVPKPLQVYTKCFKNVVSASLTAHPEFIVADLDPPYFASLPTDPPLPNVEMDFYFF